MRLFRFSYILVIIIPIVLGGCSNSSENAIGNNNLSKEPIKETIEVGEEPLRAMRPKIVDPFLAKFPSDVTGEDLGIYIRENIPSASEDEADKMLEWLIIYQDGVESDFNSKIWDDKYMDVLLNHMDGTLDKSKIPSLKDEDIKNDYITLVNSFLTIKTYDEYPVVETDWPALMDYLPYVSHDFGEVIRLNKKFSLSEYYGEGLDIDGFSKDIIILEEIAKNNPSTFIKWEANYLCRSLVHELLLGPEGNSLFYYDGKGSKEYEAIMNLRLEYPESILEEIIEELDLIDEDDALEAIRIIGKNFQFGVYTDKYLEVNRIESRDGNYELVEMIIPSNFEEQNRINNIIKEDTEEYIRSLSKDKSFSLETTIRFQNDRYISYDGTLKVTDSKGNEDYFHLYRNLDHIEGKYISLEDYFDADFVFIQDYIEDLCGVIIESLPEFQITNNGLTIYANWGRETAEVVYLERKDLLEYFTLEELIDKY